jgi:hypothetical protein
MGRITFAAGCNDEAKSTRTANQKILSRSKASMPDATEYNEFVAQFFKYLPMDRLHEIRADYIKSEIGFYSLIPKRISNALHITEQGHSVVNIFSEDQ